MAGLRKSKGKWLVGAALATAAALLVVAGSAPVRGDDRARQQAVATQYLPPEVGFVTSYSTAADVLPRPSRFKRLVRRIIGLDDHEKAMLTPNGIAVDSQGRLLVADTKGKTLHIFDPGKKKYHAVHAPDGDPFLAPIAVAVDAADNIYVSDAIRSRIFVFSREGKFQRTIGALGKNESLFKRSTGLAIDGARGRLYVVDTVAQQVVVLGLDGKVLARWGHRGSGEKEFNYPTHIAVDAEGGVWVSDSLNFRVQHFAADGSLVSAFGRLGDAPGEFDKPKGIAADGNGHVFVVEGRNDRVQVYGRDGHMLYFFGHTGSALGEFFLPTGVASDGHGTIYVADSYNRRVEVFTLRDGEAAAPGGR